MSSHYVRHELLRHQSVRYFTLINLDYTEKDKLKIVKSGFYYEDTTENFICFSCNIILDIKTPPRELIQKHKILFPKCYFLWGMDISIKSTSKIKCKGAPFTYIHEYYNRQVQFEDYKNYDIYSDLTEFLCDRSMNDSRYLTSFYSPLFIPGTGPSLEIFNIETFFLTMRLEKNRLQTYNVENYKFPHINIAEFLAKNGFFYTLISTTVQCAFCRIIIGDFQYNFDIVFYHEDLSPDCHFNRGISKNLQMIETILPSAIQPIENQGMNPENTELLICKVCYIEPINSVYKCGHLYAGDTCVRKLKNRLCPVCRLPLLLKDKRRIYLS